jgi:hypothetical protein
MRVREDAIKSVGLTLLYEPDWPIDPAVEYVTSSVLTSSITDGHGKALFSSMASAGTPCDLGSSKANSKHRRP